MEDAWAKRPEKYSELLAREKRLERASKRTSAASSINGSRATSKNATPRDGPRGGAVSAPPEVTVKSQSTVVVANTEL